MSDTCTQIGDAEAAVIRHWGKFDREFASATERLIQLLLWEFKVESGPYSRCTDGLIPQYEEKSAEAYFGTAVLWFLPDQSVEPVSLDFLLDAETQKLQGAQIQFGRGSKRDACQYAAMSAALTVWSTRKAKSRLTG